MRLREIIAALERLAPLRLQDEWDNSGLQVGFPEAETDSVLVCLDVTEAIVEEAIEKHCDVIVSHHPLLASSPSGPCPMRPTSSAAW